MDEMTLTLNNPLTEEEWDLIEDVDFDNTNSIEFHTKHGKTVKFVKCTDEITENMISRQAAIDILYDFAGCIVDTPNGHYHKAYLAYRHRMEELPSVQPEPHWIPVTERLPEHDELVLVTYKTTNKIHLCKYLDDGSENSWWSYIDYCCVWNNVVLAWMPLPEPWKAKD